MPSELDVLPSLRPFSLPSCLLSSLTSFSTWYLDDWEMGICVSIVNRHIKQRFAVSMKLGNFLWSRLENFC